MDQPLSLRDKNRLLARDVVLDAAERLLQKGEMADFSMRALAAEASISFATAFNHFGSKNAIMQALSARLIERMAEKFRNSAPQGDVIDRVFAMVNIAVALLREQPGVYRSVVGSLGVAGPVPSNVMPQSAALWSLALGAFQGIAKDAEVIARARLAEQLAFTFRGCLSFWSAGEIQDDVFRATVAASMSATMLGFTQGIDRDRLRILLLAAPP